MTDLVDASFLKKLSFLSLMAKKAVRGHSKGEKRSTTRGHAVEFADYRNYVPGDDLRSVDWNLYARLDRLYIKLFLVEEDISLYVMIDCSQSMDFGTPGKLDYARRLGAALSYIALAGLDRVGMVSFARDRWNFMPPARGTKSFPKVVRFLEGLHCGEQTSIEPALRRVRNLSKKPGYLFLISDLMDPAGFLPGIQYLRHHRWDVQIIQVLSPQELEPGLDGDVALLDAETGGLLDISVTPRVLKAYRKRLREYQDSVRDFCYKNKVGYLSTSTEVPFEEIVFLYLRRKGVLK